jgi:glucokinase-like ROK family protein
MLKATHQQTKEHNRNLVLKTIFEHTSTSRAEVARITNLTRTTISDIVADLIAEGLVTEIGMGSSIGGKSPILISLVDNSRYIIGLDLANSQFYGAVINLRGETKEMVSLPVDDCNGIEALSLVFQIIDQLTRGEFKPMVGIGVGTPGLVNTRDGVVVNAVNLAWINLPLAQLLQVRYGLPVFVLNDSQAAAMGEYTYGEGSKAGESLILINVRHGIGAGIVIDGKLFQGDGGGAGEIGHVVAVQEGGLSCRCGNHGCLETVASTQAVVSHARQLVQSTSVSSLPGDPEKITLASLEKAFSAGDPLACQVVLEAGRYMGIAIANMVGTLNIHKVVLSGDMTRFGELWLNEIRRTVEQSSLAGLVKETHINIGRLGGNRIALGASALLLSDYSLLFTH